MMMIVMGVMTTTITVLVMLAAMLVVFSHRCLRFAMSVACCCCVLFCHLPRQHFVSCAGPSTVPGSPESRNQ